MVSGFPIRIKESVMVEILRSYILLFPEGSDWKMQRTPNPMKDMEHHRCRIDVFKLNLDPTQMYSWPIRGWAQLALSSYTFKPNQNRCLCLLPMIASLVCVMSETSWAKSKNHSVCQHYRHSMACCQGVSMEFLIAGGCCTGSTEAQYFNYIVSHCWYSLLFSLQRSPFCPQKVLAQKWPSVSWRDW